MFKILVMAAAIAVAALLAAAVLSCAMLSPRISRAEERAEAKRQANLKIRKMVYNKEQEAANHEQDE